MEGRIHQLASLSPCVGVGFPKSWMPDAADLEGNPRVMGKVADFGCYEMSIPPGADLLL